GCWWIRRRGGTPRPRRPRWRKARGLSRPEPQRSGQERGRSAAGSQGRSVRAAAVPPGDPAKAPFVRGVGSPSWRAGRPRRIRYKVLGTVAGPPRIDGRSGLAPGPTDTPTDRKRPWHLRPSAPRVREGAEHFFPAAALPRPG